MAAADTTPKVDLPPLPQPGVFYVRGVNDQETGEFTGHFVTDPPRRWSDEDMQEYARQAVAAHAREWIRIMHDSGVADAVHAMRQAIGSDK